MFMIIYFNNIFINYHKIKRIRIKGNHYDYLILFNVSFFSLQEHD